MRRLHQSDMEKYIEFNRAVYPLRKGLEKSIEFKLKCPGSELDNDSFPSLIALNNDDAIIGQFQLLPCIYHYRGGKYDANWGMDYIVDEKHRGGSAGVFLAKQALKNPHFGMGLSSISFKIHILFGETHIGNYKKFIRFKSPVSLISFVLRNIFNFVTPQKEGCFVDYPQELHVKGANYKIVDDFSLFNGLPFRSDVIEFDRSSTFMKWRYGQYRSAFKIFASTSGTTLNAFFVVRLVFWKKCPFLLLVDYRYKEGYLNSLIKAVKKLLGQSKAMGIITLSTLDEIDKELHKNLFFRFGQMGSIVSNVKHKFSQDEIDNRALIQLTFADSDADFFYGNKEWYE